ncbi:hypothetical protein AAVH_21630 [Aphelenchoides avenae]|nr:hypothetical protein AAVH_32134 [Aphelenchus avenae]KAH7711076.1 hypothetical protein AAVH_21630 [Aphelenchus avenae]
MPEVTCPFKVQAQFCVFLGVVCAASRTVVVVALACRRNRDHHHGPKGSRDAAALWRRPTHDRHLLRTRRAGGCAKADRVMRATGGRRRRGGAAVALARTCGGG